MTFALRTALNPSAILTYAVALFFLTSCSRETTQNRTALKLGYISSEITVRDREEAFKTLRDYLEEQLSNPVELVQTAAYEPAIEAMKSGEIDILHFGSYSYLIAESEGSAEAFAVKGQLDHSSRNYESIIVTPAGKPWSTIEEALKNKEKLKVLFTNQASTSGFLIPSAFYQSKGINPETSFDSVEFSNSHVLSILYTSEGACDLASVSASYLKDLIERGKIESDSVRILWRSEPIPTGPVAYRSGLGEEIKASIRRAFFEVHKSNPIVWERIKAQSSDQDFIYIPFDSSKLDWLRSLAPSKR
ncbi:phosphate/phosphite/phosphonate ABC transporter substrate-binding protein [Candidatus Pelagisphaera phototrophica]|uniref:phosphate/phosphite/phosphonate ABC transporter substrate-binding protein n=1 Tax=Candidatus Pelagisphaera phototrophica TaxID=2684113 RepID=UPI001A06FCE1|nr:phosphate/phosphite/phosphonate ABC transporter substrate-binding protein [Candidatus Pelagisphaera phototrophica]QXD31741.1 phosphate/phosphite/phosphonate ABC transporter substrate-binding protein [Candidatus Pelagisphaera phototrophica]